MQVFHADHAAFRKLLVCFERIPRIIPRFSILVCDDKKPIALICLYHDSGVVFIHGIFKSKQCTKKEFLKAIQWGKKYLSHGLKSFSVVSVTKIKTLKKYFIEEGFQKEEVELFSREVNAS